MEFRVLGALEVSSGDGPRTVSGRKEVAVLAYLLVHLGRAVPADELVTAVWGEDAPPSAQKSLHVRLSRLRSALGEGGAAIKRDGAGYRLEAEPDAVDAYRFERLVADAAGRPPTEALETYGRALAEARGRPYADVADLDFVQAEIRRLEELRLRALEGRLRALLDLGRHADALPELERLIADEPLHEGFAMLHMLALYRAGRQVEALEAYRALARRLGELGLEPSVESRELERRILIQDPELDPAAASATNVGARLTSFVGREDELADLVARLREHRLVTVSGPGGVGKTSLALEAARALLDERSGGVWFIELAAVREAGEVPGAIAAVLGVTGTGLDPRTAGGALEVLREHLRERHALLVFDNCEHLSEPVAQVAEALLAAAPGVRILATSRRALDASGEVLVDLEPFPPPNPAALEESAAVQLFVERARAVRPDFKLDPTTAGPVAAICARLDGLPLALELAAARVRALSVADIAARLDDRFSLLTTGRGRTLAGVVTWSHGLLDTDERVLFRRLAVFHGPFTLRAAEAVAGVDPLGSGRVADVLAALVDRSMVAVDGERFRLLETLREFGRVRLADAGEAELLTARHARHFAASARDAAALLWAGGVDAVADELLPAREDYAAAGEYALALEDAALALPLATALGLLEYRFGEGERGDRRLAAALGREGGHPRDRLAALRIHAALLLLAGQLWEGTESVEAAEGLAAALGDPVETDRVRTMVGLALLLARDVEGAAVAFAGLEDRMAERGELWAAGFAAGWSAFVSLLQGDLVCARDRSRRSLDAFTRCGDLWGRLMASLNLSRSAMALGMYAEAAVVCDDALALAEGRIGDRIVPVLHDAGVAELRRGRLHRALGLWERCAERADREMGVTGGWVMLTARGLRWYPLMAAGHLARASGEPGEAARRYRQALDVLDQVSDDALGRPTAQAMTLTLLGRLALDSGRPADAERLYREALDAAGIARDRRLVPRLLQALAGAVAAAEDDRCGEAAELLGRADALLAAAGGPLAPPDVDEVDQLAADLRERLGEEAYAAAYDRGQAAGDAVSAL
jgi:predicted ATPase/DNA-binding SARP family transcriptional activator